MTQQLQKSIDFRRIELYDFHLCSVSLQLRNPLWGPKNNYIGNFDPKAWTFSKLRDFKT